MAQYFISFRSCVENSECATKKGYDSPAKESYHRSLCVVTEADPGFFLGGVHSSLALLQHNKCLHKL